MVILNNFFYIEQDHRDQVSYAQNQDRLLLEWGLTQEEIDIHNWLHGNILFT